MVGGHGVVVHDCLGIDQEDARTLQSSAVAVDETVFQRYGRTVTADPAASTRTSRTRSRIAPDPAICDLDVGTAVELKPTATVGETVEDAATVNDAVIGASKVDATSVRCAAIAHRAISHGNGDMVGIDGSAFSRGAHNVSAPGKLAPFQKARIWSPLEKSDTAPSV